MHSLTCRYCGRKLGILDRWRHQHYCSVECKQSFQRENARLAVEWLSELNRTACKPETAPSEDDFPEPVEPGFVAQPLPVGNDLPIRAVGFPTLKPGRDCPRGQPYLARHLALCAASSRGVLRPRRLSQRRTLSDLCTGNRQCRTGSRSTPCIMRSSARPGNRVRCLRHSNRLQSRSVRLDVVHLQTGPSP
jgi:hypothetical protein